MDSGSTRPIFQAVYSPVFEAIYRAFGGSSAPAFDPLDLFTGGYTGGYYDSSDLSTLWQDFVSNVTADGQTYIVHMDKSQGLALGSNTATTGYTNSGGLGFDTFSVAGTALTIAEVGTNGRARTNDAKALVAGGVYKVVVDVTSITGSVQVTIWNAALSATYTTGVSINSTGLKTFYFQAPSAQPSAYIGFFASSAMSAVVEVLSFEEVAGSHLYQGLGAQRQAYKLATGLSSGLSDGVDDNMGASSSGGSTTAFCFMTCVKITQVGVRQTLFSDVGANTGYKVELNTSNQLVISAGNGASYTTATTANTFAINDTVSIEAYDDGTNIGVCLNNGAPVTATRPTVSAGTAGFTIGKDNGAASGYFKGNNYGVIYNKNKANTPTERANAITWLRAKGGL